MYINAKRRYVSNSICISAIIGLLSQILNAFARVFFDVGLDEPDMLNNDVSNFYFLVQIIVIFVIFFIFYHNAMKLRYIMRKVPDEADDNTWSNKPLTPENSSSLKAESINQLLEIWGIIMIFNQIISMVSSYQYKSFVEDLYEIIPADTYENAVIFSGIYNSTHGFKYIGMVSAIVIGLFVSAVFLKDRFLKIVSLVITVFFLIAFSAFQMVTFDTDIKIISIVWTSVIYHGLETFGLIIFSVYLTRHYKGI